MYVSGTLKNKSINFYREKMTCYDCNAISTLDISLSYDGELSFAPWDKDKESRLIKKQQLYISKLKENINSLITLKFANNKCGTNYIMFFTAINKIYDSLNNTNPKFYFVLLECLYNLVKNTSNDWLYQRLNQFLNLINYLNDYDKNLTQSEIDIIINLFLNNKNYSDKDILNFKINNFKINKKNITDSKVYEIYRLGEFIAPNRLAYISQNLLREELTRYIAPIYFAIKDEEHAKKFLKLCRTSDLDFDKIEKNATLCRVPDNLIEMVRR